MKRLLAIATLALALFAGPVAAQQDDRGVLQAFLEDNLSDAGREVRITGFEGALSGRATLEELTIADATGIWLTIEDAVFDWNRGALLRGRLEIVELSAKKVTVARAPRATDGLPTPEATPFALPELPVSIQIGKFEIDELLIGEPILGMEASFSVDGAAVLAEGAGSARLEVSRKGGPEGELKFEGAYSNTTERLGLNLALIEDRGGIAATLLGLPDRPPLEFRVNGDGPIGDFTAEIDLSTEGQQRLAGHVTLTSQPDPDNAQQITRRVAVDIGGDLRPLVEPRYRPFLGGDLRLMAAGARLPDGRLELDELTLRADAMMLRGAAAIAADGWPERINLTGRILPVDGTAVLLSIPGPEIRIAGAEIALKYDAATGDTWALSADLDGLQHPELALDSARISGRGVLSRDLQTVDGALDLALVGLAPADQALAQAIGATLNGNVRFAWRQGAALRFPAFSLSGTDYAVSGNATVEGIEGQIDLAISVATKLEARDLSRFSALAGQDLSGGAALQITGQVQPVSGGFDLEIAGTGRDLGIGQPRIDPLIAGVSGLSVRARRDTTGLQVERLQVTSEAARIAARGRFSSDDSDFGFEVTLNDAARVLPGAQGKIALSGTATQAGPRWDFDVNATAPGATSAEIRAQTTVIDGQAGAFSTVFSLDIGDLTPFAGLAERPIAGALSLSANASGDLGDTTFSATLEGKGTDIRTGIAEADLLLRGQSTFAAALRRETNDLSVIDRFELRTPQLVADLTGSVGEASTRLRYSIDLRDLGFLVSGLNGPVSAEGVVSATNGPWTVTSALTGPGGTTVAVDGQVARDGATANLAITGTAPIALANRFIAPNLAEGTARLDLRLDGPPGLTALSGTVRAGGARIILPNLRLGLTDVSAEARLSGGAAQIVLEGGLSNGGRFSLNGHLALTAPYSGDLTAVINDAVVRQSGLYETIVDGRLNIVGALGGGAAVTGALTLGPTEIRVPDGAAAEAGALPGLVHLNPPPRVRQTLRRAGLIATSRGGLRAAYPIDLSVSAPNRIFIRGRGLDAELGGALRLGGDSANVITSGRFDLIRGRLDILGKRLTLSEASARLRGDFDPYIRAVASTDSAGTRIQVIVEGPASAPEITFASSPDLPEDEILARLLFGRNLAEISPLQALQIANAVRVLAGRGGEGIVGRLRQNFGLDDLDIATGEDADAGLRVGKYISENVYTDVTVDTTGRSEINLNLTLTPSVTARGSVASEGKSSLGVFFERDY